VFTIIGYAAVAGSMMRFALRLAVAVRRCV